jgi:hypothetical protein
LVGRCESCGRLGELFQLPDRRDCNCADCNADISKLVSIYGRLEIAQPYGEHEAFLQNQLTAVLQRFLARSGFDGSAQFCAWPENIAKREHVN